MKIHEKTLYIAPAMKSVVLGNNAMLCQSQIQENNGVRLPEYELSGGDNSNDF